MSLQKTILVGLFFCLTGYNVLAQKNDSLNNRYVFLKTILGDTSNLSFLMLICLWDEPSQQFQFGFVSNRDLYKYVSKKNSTASLNQYFDEFYNYPEYGYKWNCFFLDQKYPEVALINSFYLPNQKKTRSIKKFLINYFDANGYLKEYYWPYWPQIANYLFEKQIPVRFRQGLLPIEIRMVDYQKYVLRH